MEFRGVDRPDGEGGGGRRPTILPLEEALAAAAPAAPATGVSRPSAVHSVFRRVTIGRAPENDVVVDDMLVSRRHAELHGVSLPLHLSHLLARSGDRDSHNGWTNFRGSGHRAIAMLPELTRILHPLCTHPN